MADQVDSNKTPQCGVCNMRVTGGAAHGYVCRGMCLCPIFHVCEECTDVIEGIGRLKLALEADTGNSQRIIEVENTLKELQKYGFYDPGDRITYGDAIADVRSRYEEYAAMKQGTIGCTHCCPDCFDRPPPGLGMDHCKHPNAVQYTLFRCKKYVPGTTFNFDLTKYRMASSPGTLLGLAPVSESDIAKRRKRDTEKQHNQ